jgi:outer membrane lipoprotein SlyB
MHSVTPLPRSTSILAAIAVLGLAGCASTSTPVVYPSAKATQSQRADADLKACRAEADAAVGVNGTHSRTAGTRTAQRGSIEFVDKAVESMVNGSKEVWAKARGASAGAMAGSLTAVALNWNEPDGVYRNYVDLCLKERGHKVLGWR